MKYIEKKEEPEDFRDWKNKENENWKPDYSSLDKDIRISLKNSLIAEQGYLCCYCERRLDETDSHIEHLVPQSLGLVDPLDYGNLLCSCQDQISRGEPRHCGNLKENWYDESQLISPLDKSCEGRFAYTGNGKIKLANENDSAAQETIEKLGLDIDKLKDLRKKVISRFFDPGMSKDDRKKFAEGYLKMKDGRYNPFYTTIWYLFLK